MIYIKRNYEIKRSIRLILDAFSSFLHMVQFQDPLRNYIKQRPTNYDVANYHKILRLSVLSIYKMQLI
jgi:hypothetical protein